MAFDKKKIAAELEKKLDDNHALENSSKEAIEATRMFSETPKLAIDTEKAWYSVSSRIRTETSSNKLYFKVAAAVAFLVVAASAFYFLNGNSENIYTAQKKSREVQLNDGSQITLNTNTTLKVEKSFGGSSRSVFLEGEAYFEVSEDVNKPFIAKTPNAQIKVLGTSFNIDATDSETQVYVKSGSVEVSTGNNEKIVLTKGQKVKVNQQGISQLNPEINELAWQSGILVFDNDPISEVISSLSDLHGVTINYDQKIGDCMVTIKFENTSLSESLKLLGKIIPIKIQKKNKEYFISGKGC